MLNPDIIFVFLFGIIMGVIFATIMTRMTILSVGDAAKQQDREGRRDPANWWKYGDDPFSYDDDEDDGGLPV